MKNRAGPLPFYAEEEPTINPHTKLAWRVGGPQGSGVDTAAGTFARACAAGGLHVFGRREYYSNIMGRHSYFDVRVSPEPLKSHSSSVHLLATFEAETLARHANAVVPGGAILYRRADAEVELDRITYLDEPVRENLTALLTEHDLPVTTGGLLEEARRRGVLTLEVPYGDIGDRLREELGVSSTVADRMINTVSVAVSCALLGYDPDYLRQALERTFAGRGRIVDMNMVAVKAGYDFVAGHVNDGDFGFTLEPVEGEVEKRIFVTGNQAVALGKLAGGATFQTYYPISPATDESVYLEGNGTFATKDGGEGSLLVVQTEDELAAVTMAIGGALTGARSSTATSGPGFALMAEAIGWAGINEVPLVVTVYQRGGPSTGLPTRTEQGDLQFAVKAGHGEFPRFVIASGDLEESFEDAAAAFNYAEKYQTVVIHMLDKTLSSTSATIPPFDVDGVTIERGALLAEGPGGAPDPAGFPRFEITESGISPRPVMGQEGATHWVTGGEHNERGRVTEDPTVREQMMEKRERKMELAMKEIPAEEKFQVYGDPDAAVTLLSWGSNKGAILEAIELLAEKGIAARLVQVRMLWPFPGAELEELLAGASPLVAVEANFSGQLANLLREQTGIRCHHRVLKYNGRPFTGAEVARAVASLETAGGDVTAERIVIRNPYE